MGFLPWGLGTMGKIMVRQKRGKTVVGVEVDPQRIGEALGQISLFTKNSSLLWAVSMELGGTLNCEE